MIESRFLRLPAGQMPQPSQESKLRVVLGSAPGERRSSECESHGSELKTDQWVRCVMEGSTLLKKTKKNKQKKKQLGHLLSFEYAK